MSHIDPTHPLAYDGGPRGCAHVQRLLRPHLRPGFTLYEIGGDLPCIDLALKRELNLRIVALDAHHRLPHTPLGLYDTLICADALDYRGARDGDIVVWQDIPEDRTRQERLFETVAGLVKPGGLVLLHSLSNDREAARHLRALAGIYGMIAEREDQSRPASNWRRALGTLNRHWRPTRELAAGISLTLRRCAVPSTPVLPPRPMDINAVRLAAESAAEL